ncbi:MAG: nitrous oxide reductase family maturation protein NosD [Promethearchaeota archaeon]
MPDRDKVSRCFLSVTLVMILMALAASVTPAADLDGTAHQSTTAVSETKRGGMLAAGTTHGPIAIDGDANFSATAFLEGWPGYGSPEHPFIIDGLDIDLGGAPGNCIGISNTQVSFIIRNCILTGAVISTPWGAGGWGIYLLNVANGELVNNTCLDTDGSGIFLLASDYNTLADNTCINTGNGIDLCISNHNTVANNTCNTDGNGIWLTGNHTTVVNNTCNSNGGHGIKLEISNSNTVADNTCTSNGEDGISLDDSHFNIVTNNMCNSSNYNGIELYLSDDNTLESNICINNTGIGILLDGSNFNTLTKNICNYNRIGIWFHNSYSNTWVKNICSGNTEQGMFEDFEPEEPEEIEFPEVEVPEALLVFGFITLTLLGAGWRKTKLSREDISEPWIDGYAIPDHKRLICSRCGATYLYGPQHAIRTGIVRCQNCDQEFLSGATD